MMGACGLAICLSAITAVVDGDTLKESGQRFRLWGLDAPEMSEAGGQRAKAELERLTLGEPLACNHMDTDRYGRPVVQCYLPDGRDLACEMIASGKATEWVHYSGGYYRGC